MAYRTRTYISGEWDCDSDAIDQIYKWNESDKWNLHFGGTSVPVSCSPNQKE